MADVGTELRRFRAINGLTQRELGELLHITTTQVAAYELGRARPRPKWMKRIADVIGVPIQEFYPELFGGPPITFKRQTKEGNNGISR